jgi:DNA helicase-2/ATP-dependent DNA helicase PcrA
MLVTAIDEAEQTELVCQNILAHLEQGTSLRRQAVLFRASHHSAVLEVELARRNIPFHKYGGLKFIEAAHIKDVLAFLRILENPFDEISWFRVLQLFEGVGPRTAQRLMDELQVRRPARPSTADAPTPLTSLVFDPPPMPKSLREALGELRSAVVFCLARTSPAKTAEERSLSSTTEEPPLSRQIERIRKFYDPILERAYENASVRSRDLDQLTTIATRYRSRSRFITDLTLDPPQATSDLAQAPFLEEDYLILSTIHSAKGCEWDVVYIIHAADGMIPSDMAISDEDGVEEERRLFYVALTRAKDMLYVCFPLRYYHRRFGLNDAHGYAQLTRFLIPAARALFVDAAGEKARYREDSDIAASVQPYSRVKRLWAT